MRYIETLKKYTKEYFKVLSPDYPEWLDEYIETERMQKQQYISSLDHSIAVALIIWNFTHDKKQTLSGYSYTCI